MAYRIRNYSTTSEFFPSWAEAFAENEKCQRRRAECSCALRRSSFFTYYAYGREDPVVRNSAQLKSTLEKYNIKLTLHETGAGTRGLTGAST